MQDFALQCILEFIGQERTTCDMVCKRWYHISSDTHIYIEPCVNAVKWFLLKKWLNLQLRTYRLRGGASIEMSGPDVIQDVQTKTHVDKSLNPKLECIMRRYWSHMLLYQLCPNMERGSYIVLLFPIAFNPQDLQELLFTTEYVIIDVNRMETMQEVTFFMRIQCGHSEYNDYCDDPVASTLRCSDTIRTHSIAEKQRLEFGSAFTTGWQFLGLNKSTAHKRVVIDWTPSTHGGVYGTKIGLKTASHHMKICDFLLCETDWLFKKKNTLLQRCNIIYVKAIIKIARHYFLCLHFRPLLDLHEYVSKLTLPIFD